jgi:hypothetical protein
VPILTLPAIVWRTPEAWGGRHLFFTWDKLCKAAVALRDDGITADAGECDQYLLIGAHGSGVEYGWYHRLTRETQDGVTTYVHDCVLLDQHQFVLRDKRLCFMKPSALMSSEDEKALLMRCLSSA